MNAESARAARDRQRGQPARTPQPCGTIAAVRRHEYRGEPLCDLCLVARREHNAEMYRRRKQRQNGTHHG